MNRESTKKRSTKEVTGRISPSGDSETYRDLASNFEHKASLIENKSEERYMQKVSSGDYDNLNSNLDSYLTEGEKSKRDKLLRKAKIYTVLAEKAPYKTFVDKHESESREQERRWLRKMSLGDVVSVVLILIGVSIFPPSITGMVIGGLSKMPVNITGLSFIILGILSFAFSRKWRLLK